MLPRGYSLLDIVNPITTLGEIEQIAPNSAMVHYFSAAGDIIIVLSLAALASVLLNLRAMLRGGREILHADLKPLRPDHPSPETEIAGQVTTAS